MDLKSKIILISGPTASGKSSFAIKFAKKINGEIINADSMQVYKQLKILSARPDPKKHQKIKHHWYGFHTVSKNFSTGDWLKLAIKKVKEVQKRKLQKSDLIQYFETVTISEDVGVKKPHKLIFDHALTAANANVENSVMIGDNFNADILGALGVGMKAIYYDFHKTNEQERENLIIIKNLKELIKILN